MRKINLSNDTKRDAEVAFGTTFHRLTPVYKTSDGKKSVNERRVRATMKTTDEALLAQYGEGLADADAMMLVGGGQKGVEPLVMANGGTPYRAFLEGRVDGDRYALILPLTNMELKSVVY